MEPIHFDGLILRAFENSDATDFVEAARESVSSVGPWMPWCHSEFSDSDALNWFELCRQGHASGTAYEFGIFSEGSSEFLGGAGLNSIKLQHRFCNLGYWVRQSKQKQGVALRSVHALSSHAFTVLGLHRVEIVVANGNVPSEAVAKKSGAVFECVARNRLHIHGVSVPASVFSLVPK